MLRKNLCVIVGLVVVAGVSALRCAAQDVEGQAELQKERTVAATKIARAYFVAMQNADVPTLLALSDVPYARDGKEIFESMSELKQHIAQGSNKWQHKLQKYKIFEANVLDDKREIADGGFAVDRIIVEIVVTGIDKEEEEEGEKPSFNIYVKPGDAYRVIGVRG